MRLDFESVAIMSSSLSKAAQAYESVNLESRVASSTGSELVSLLYEGFLGRVNSAKLALESGDVSARVTHIGKAVLILTEGLRTHLDLKAGGELARNLDTVYQYAAARLVEANLKCDAGMLVEVHDLIEPLAQAWKDNWVEANGKVAESVVKARNTSNLSSQFKCFSGAAAYADSARAGG